MDLNAFLADLVAVCKKHNGVILNRDEEGFMLTTWEGLERYKMIAGYWLYPRHVEGTPQLVVDNITPEGVCDGEMQKL